MYINFFLLCFLQEELEKSRHELEDLDMQIAQLKAVSGCVLIMSD